MGSHLSIENMLHRIDEEKERGEKFFLVSKKELKNNSEIQRFFINQKFYLYPVYDEYIFLGYRVFFEKLTKEERQVLDKMLAEDKAVFVKIRLIMVVSICLPIVTFFMTR